MRSLCLRISWLVTALQLLNHVSCLASSELHHHPRKSAVRVVSTNKNGGAAKTFTFGDGETTTTGAPVSQSQSVGILPAILSGLRSTFLPSGYPSKIPTGYFRYAIWSWLQDLSTQLRGVLATQRILEGVGVGRPGATALSAMLNFLVRDGCGMAATLLFTASAASRFQGNVKKWRLFADVMVDIGITLEVAAAQVPQSMFLPMICIGNMCKAMCGVAAGAVGGAINLHWAGSGGTDISDISAKFGAQQTVTASLGLVAAAVMAKSISTLDFGKVWLLYGALTALHIFANVRCMRLIAFDTFNAGRLEMVFQQFWEQYTNQTASADDTTISLATPHEIAAREPLFFLVPRKRRTLGAWLCAFVGGGVGMKAMRSALLLTQVEGVGRGVGMALGVAASAFIGAVVGAGVGGALDAARASGSAEVEIANIQFGVPFNDIVNHQEETEADRLKEQLQQPYWLARGDKRRRKKSTIMVALSANATPRQCMEGYFGALVASSATTQEQSGAPEAPTAAAWAQFCQACEAAGWNLDQSNIASQGYEVDVVVTGAQNGS